jgi:o-succinylbenzoate synthase
VLSLVADSGELGFGEALPLAGFGNESVAQADEALERLARTALGRDLRDIDLLLDQAHVFAAEEPTAQAALDAALFDLAARAGGMSVSAFLAEPRTARMRVRASALLRGTTPSELAAQAQRASAEGFQTLKLKVGAEALSSDEARVAAIREAVGADVKLRIDANGAWKETEAKQALLRFAPYAIEFCEQPVEARDIAGLARVRAVSPIPIAADEALTGGHAVGEILDRNAADLLVLKPAVLGGLRASLRIAASARAKGVGCVVTSAFDSALGLTAALQLAAALPGPSPDAGLATGGAFVEDLALAPMPTQGEIALPEDSGMGIVPRPAALARCAVGSTREIVA